MPEAENSEFVSVSRRYCNGDYRFVEGREHIAADCKTFSEIFLTPETVKESIAYFERLPLMTLAEYLEMFDSNQIDYNRYLPFPEITDYPISSVGEIGKCEHGQSREPLHFLPANTPQEIYQPIRTYPHGAKFDGDFVFCPSCKKWDVSGIQRTECNLCGSTIEYVLSDRWSCKGTYIADKGFPTKCYGRGRSPNVAGDECAFGCDGSTLKTAKRVRISLGYHKLTEISEKEYKEEICFVGDAPHTKSHVQKLDRDRIDLRRRLTRGSVGSQRCRVNQVADVVEPLINPLTEMPEIDPKSGKVVIEEYSLKCDECGSIVRYNELYEKECTGCGLLASQSAYRSMENYFNANIGEEQEAQSDDDWLVQAFWQGSEKERSDYIRDWRAERRKGEGAERADLNEAQHDSWRKEAKRISKEHGDHKYIPRTEEDIRMDFRDCRLWTLLNMNGGRIKQADIPALFKSEFNGATITERQAEESVKRTAKLGRIEVEAVYGTPEGKRIIINRLPISHSIANT